MAKATKKKNLLILFLLIGALFFATFFIGGHQKTESIRETMRDAVLHDAAKVNMFGLWVNPGFAAACCVTLLIFVFCLIVRIFVIPRFTRIPGRFQLLLEAAVGFFDNLAKTNSPHCNGFLGAYVFTAGVYIFVSTLFELFGVQVITTHGTSLSLPAPLSDINGAIAMGLTSYLVILGGGVVVNKGRGALRALKEFSLPISMSFRLFGSLLSGALVTELVYYTSGLSYGLPVVVGVLFTLLHALIQAYVLTMLTSVFFGEVTEKVPPKEKNHRDCSESVTET